MPKHVFTRAQYLQILNDSLRRDPRWRPGMAFVFLPAGANAESATGVGCTGPDEALPVYAEIEQVAANLIEVSDAPEDPEIPDRGNPDRGADGVDVLDDVASRSSAAQPRRG